MNISGCECSKTLPNHLAFGVLLVESHLDIVYTEQGTNGAPAVPSSN